MLVQVHAAKERKSGELVALKQLYLSEDRSIPPHIQREIVALRRLSHPNVVRLLDTQQEVRRVFDGGRNWRAGNIILPEGTCMSPSCEACVTTCAIPMPGIWTDPGAGALPHRPPRVADVAARRGAAASTHHQGTAAAAPRSSPELSRSRCMMGRLGLGLVGGVDCDAERRGSW